MCFEEFTWSITFDLDIRVYIYTQDVFSLHIGKEKFLVAINSSTMPKIGMLYVIEIKVYYKSDLL
jgi:hypothetical protein